jgi:hypothetical protein
MIFCFIVFAICLLALLYIHYDLKQLNREISVELRWPHSAHFATKQDLLRHSLDVWGNHYKFIEKYEDNTMYYLYWSPGSDHIFCDININTVDNIISQTTDDDIIFIFVNKGGKITYVDYVHNSTY